MHLVHSICRWVELRFQNLITIRSRWEIATGTLTTLRSLALDGTVWLLSGSFLVLEQAHCQQSRYPDDGGDLKLLLASSMHAERCFWSRLIEISKAQVGLSMFFLHIDMLVCTLVAPNGIVQWRRRWVRMSWVQILMVA